MRVILIGTGRQRDRLRELLDTAPDVVGEFASAAAAAEAGLVADALLLAASSPARQNDEQEAETLTSRELDVLELVAEGLSNRAIATRLGISDQTVKFHLAAVSGKLGAANRTDAVRRAVRRGLITL